MTDTEHWPKYQSHKVVRAAKIVAIHDDGEGPDFLWVDPGTGTLERFIPTEPAMMGRAQVGGYAVAYDNDFLSVSPKAPFEEGYVLAEEDDDG
jgi:hypothetical protein